MRKGFWLSFLFFFGIAQAGYGATSSSISESAPSRRLPANKVRLSFASGLINTGGQFAGSFLTGVSFQVDRTSPIRLGLETGAFFATTVALPILVSLSYQPLSTSTARPYVAGSVGPLINLTRGSVALALLVRPGITFRVADSMDLFTEMQFGGLTGIFYIAPTLGVNVHL